MSLKQALITRFCTIHFPFDCYDCCWRSKLWNVWLPHKVMTRKCSLGFLLLLLILFFCFFMCTEHLNKTLSYYNKKYVGDKLEDKTKCLLWQMCNKEVFPLSEFLLFLPAFAFPAFTILTPPYPTNHISASALLGPWLLLFKYHSNPLLFGGLLLH